MSKKNLVKRNGYGIRAILVKWLAAHRNSAVVAALVIALLGVVALRLAGAATNVIAVEAETGTISGNAGPGEAAGASAGAAVKFGAGSVTPGPTPGAQATYPLRVSSDKRFVQGSNGAPFFWQADTAWNLSNNLDEAEWVQYLDARKNQGYNTIYTTLVQIEGGTVSGTTNQAGAKLFINGDMGRPNPDWFNSFDKLLALARDRGMQLAVWPAWSQLVRDQSSFTTANMTTYGKFLGERYKNTPNIVWVMGGDWGNGAEGDCPLTSQVRALANGIKSVDQNHLMSYHTGSGQISSDCHNDQSWLDINGAYWDFRFQNLQSGYSLTRKAYNNTPTRPTVMLEPMYEGPTPTRADADKLYPYDSRIMSAFQIMSGSMGLGHGMNSTFRMVNGHQGNTASWQDTIKRPGGTYQGNIANLFRQRYTNWLKMVPDLNNSVLTGGAGTVGSQDYALAGRSTDGSMIIAFTPVERTLTIDMSKMAGSTTARWYDSTNATYKTISGSPFTNTGSRQFQTPGNNSAGQSDWYLVLETNPVQ